MFNPFTFDYLEAMGLTPEEFQEILTTTTVIYFPLSITFCIMIGAILYCIRQVIRYMKNGPEPMEPPYNPKRDRNVNFELGIKLLSIEKQLDLAEKGLMAPEYMPYRDQKRLVKKHDNYYNYPRYENKVPELVIEDNSYHPYTLIEQKCGKAEVPFDYSFPQHFVKPDNTWYCFKKENRWW